MADTTPATLGLVNLCKDLNFLTHLKIKTYESGDVEGIFVDILQNLVMLEYLDFESVEIHEFDEEDNRRLASKLEMPNQGRLKSLSLELDSCRSKDMMKMSKLFFQFILEACPLLQEFKLNGSIGASAALNLDFRQRAELKLIAIKMHGCRYYTFHHLYFGKQWKNVGKCMSNEDLSEEEQKKLPFYINLVWMDNKDVKLQLADCKV